MGLDPLRKDPRQTLAWGRFPAVRLPPMNQGQRKGKIQSVQPHAGFHFAHGEGHMIHPESQVAHTVFFN